MNKRQIKKRNRMLNNNNNTPSKVSSLKRDVQCEIMRMLNMFSFKHLNASNVSVNIGWMTHRHYVDFRSTHIEISDAIELTHTESNTIFCFTVHTKDIPIAVLIALRKLDAIVDNNSKVINTRVEFFKGH